MGGNFTPTEAAVVAIAYAFLLGIFIRRDIPLKDLPRIALETAKLTGVMMFIVACAQSFAWVMMREHAGKQR